MISDILETDIGKIVIPIVWGFGLALMFRKVCNDRSCIIIKGPEPKEFTKHIYKYNNDKNCYKYKTYITKCKK
jgi:hypothetical protein